MPFYSPNYHRLIRSELLEAEEGVRRSLVADEEASFRDHLWCIAPLPTVRTSDNKILHKMIDDHSHFNSLNYHLPSLPVCTPDSSSYLRIEEVQVLSPDKIHYSSKEKYLISQGLKREMLLSRMVHKKDDALRTKEQDNRASKNQYSELFRLLYLAKENSDWRNEETNKRENSRIEALNVTIARLQQQLKWQLSEYEQNTAAFQGKMVNLESQISSLISALQYSEAQRTFLENSGKLNEARHASELEIERNRFNELINLFQGSKEQLDGMNSQFNALTNIFNDRCDVIRKRLHRFDKKISCELVKLSHGDKEKGLALHPNSKSDFQQTFPQIYPEYGNSLIQNSDLPKISDKKRNINSDAIRSPKPKDSNPSFSTTQVFESILMQNANVLKSSLSVPSLSIYHTQQDCFREGPSRAVSRVSGPSQVLPSKLSTNGTTEEYCPKEKLTSYSPVLLSDPKSFPKYPSILQDGQIKSMDSLISNETSLENNSFSVEANNSNNPEAFSSTLGKYRSVVEAIVKRQCNASALEATIDFLPQLTDSMKASAGTQSWLGGFTIDINNNENKDIRSDKVDSPGSKVSISDSFEVSTLKAQIENQNELIKSMKKSLHESSDLIGRLTHDNFQRRNLISEEKKNIFINSDNMANLSPL